MTMDSPTTGSHKLDHDDNGSNSWLKWLLAALVLLALVIGAFFVLGGDADVDVDPGDVDVTAPDVGVDVDAPDVDVEAPDVDVDPGDIDVDDASADADLDPDE